MFLNQDCKLLDFNKNFEIYAFEKYPGVQTHPSAAEYVVQKNITKR